MSLEVCGTTHAVPGWTCRRAAGHSGPCAAVRVVDIEPGSYLPGNYTPAPDALSAGSQAYWNDRERARGALVWAERLRAEFWRGFYAGVLLVLAVRGLLFLLQVVFSQ